jgi:hypothetical protein
MACAIPVELLGDFGLLFVVSGCGSRVLDVGECLLMGALPDLQLANPVEEIAQGRGV